MATGKATASTVRPCLPAAVFFIISIFVDRGPPRCTGRRPAGFFLACVSRPAVVFASVNPITVLIQLTVRFMYTSKFIFLKKIKYCITNIKLYVIDVCVFFNIDLVKTDSLRIVFFLDGWRRTSVSLPLWFLQPVDGRVVSGRAKTTESRH